MPSKRKSKMKLTVESQAASADKEDSKSIEELIETFKPESRSRRTNLPKVVMRPMQQQNNVLPGNPTTDAPPPAPRSKPKTKPKKKRKGK